MEQSIARGYIKKVKSIKDKRSITNRFAAYKGILDINKKEIIVEVYSDDEDFKSDEIFVKLSVDTLPELERIL